MFLRGAGMRWEGQLIGNNILATRPLEDVSMKWMYRPSVTEMEMEHGNATEMDKM